MFYAWDILKSLHRIMFPEFLASVISSLKQQTYYFVQSRWWLDQCVGASCVCQCQWQLGVGGFNGMQRIRKAQTMVAVKKNIQILFHSFEGYLPVWFYEWHRFVTLVNCYVRDRTALAYAIWCLWNRVLNAHSTSTRIAMAIWTPLWKVLLVLEWTWLYTFQFRQQLSLICRLVLGWQINMTNLADHGLNACAWLTAIPRLSIGLSGLGHCHIPCACEKRGRLY